MFDKDKENNQNQIYCHYTENNEIVWLQSKTKYKMNRIKI